MATRQGSTHADRSQNNGQTRRFPGRSRLHAGSGSKYPELGQTAASSIGWLWPGEEESLCCYKSRFLKQKRQASGTTYFSSTRILIGTVLVKRKVPICAYSKSEYGKMLRFLCFRNVLRRLNFC